MDKTEEMSLNVWADGEAVLPADLNANFVRLEKEFQQRGINILWRNADPSGIKDSSAAIVELLSQAVGTLFIPQGIYTVKQNIVIPEMKKLIFDRGARLKPAANRTITINGTIQASPDEWIFDTSAGGFFAGSMKVDVMHPQWFGTSDGSALQKALNASINIKAPVKLLMDKTVNNAVTLGDGVSLLSESAHTIRNDNAAVAGDLRINGSDITVDNVSLEGATAQSVYFTGTNERVRLSRLNIKTTGHGVQLNTPNADNISFSNSDVSAEKYGLLFNSNAKLGKNIRVTNNTIYSRTCDAIELNNPGSGAVPYDGLEGVVLLGNHLAADGAGTGSQSGFAIGIAHTHDVVAIGNISEMSRGEAVHIEGDQQNIIVSGNVFNGCAGDGCRIQNSPLAKPPQITGNSFIRKNEDRAGSGIYRLYDTRGSLECNVANNYIRGFGRGLWIDGPAVCHAEGTYIENCLTAIYVGDGGRVSGGLMVKNCPTLAVAKSGAVIDKITALTTPSTILAYGGIAGRIGATLHQLTAFTNPVDSVAGQNAALVLFPLPRLFSARLNCRIDAGTSKLVLSADVSWDGATLSVSNLIKRQAGSIMSGYGGRPPIANQDGQLALNVFTSARLAGLVVHYDFTGMYYVE